MSSIGTISKPLKDLWASMRVTKRFWGAPAIVIWVLLGAALVLSHLGT